MTDEQSLSEGQLKTQLSENATMLERELAAWEREDREEASEIATIERQIADQTLRITELEKSWERLGKRAAGHAERAGELERALARLEEVAQRARSTRRAATAELTRAERRAANAQGELADQKDAIARLEAVLTEKDEDISALRNAQRTREEELEESRANADRHETEAARLTAAHERLERHVEEAEERLAEQETEKRALFADLVRTRSILQARSEQLQRLMRSKWLRLARVTWRARRRPPIVAMLLTAAAVAGAIAAVLVVNTP